MNLPNFKYKIGKTRLAIILLSQQNTFYRNRTKLNYILFNFPNFIEQQTGRYINNL